MDKYKWNLEKIYANDKDINADVDRVNVLLETYKEFSKKKSVPDMLKIVENISILISKLICYSTMKRDEDSTNPKYQKLALDIEQISSKVDEALSSLEPMILDLEDIKVQEYKKLMTDDYIKVIDKIIRKKPHILSEKEEKILSVTQDVASDTENSYYMLSYADMSFPAIESDKEKKILTHANYHNFQTDKNRNIRKESFEKMHLEYKKYINTFSANYYGHVKAKEKIANLRNYPSNLHQELFKDDIDINLYTSLIDAIHESIPLFSKYLDTKKEALKLEDFTNYDLYVDIFDKKQKTNSYEDAVKIIKDALKPMGDEYLAILEKAFDDRWIDVYPRKGKKSGAYSFGSYGTDPYILTNYTDNINSLFTLAHELGHSIHSYYSRNNNPYFTSNYTIFVAEVASTTNELLLYEYLLKNAKSEIEKKSLLVYNLEQFRTTVYRQTMFAEFEKIVHDKVISSSSLTADILDEIYLELNKKYYPTIDVHPLIAHEWARIPHFYSDFYVYKYSTGFCCATVFADKILSDPSSVNRYINFLKDGGNNYPLTQLKNAGVDISKKETILKAMSIFKDRLKKLNKNFFTPLDK